MALKVQYERAKEELLEDREICPDNRKLFSTFFEFEEYKLKRRNNLAQLDAACHKTLLAYISRFRTVNRWFANKPWKKLTKADIKAVYDALEDGKILSRFGRPIKDKQTYYNHILRSKPFQMAGKLEIVNEVMEFSSPLKEDEVRFIREDTFRAMLEAISNLEHKCFLWLCWDLGENATSLLKLRKSDCTRQLNEITKDPEYLVNLRRETLKRSRQPRSELTNYRETVRFLDHVLSEKGPEQLLFDFGVRWAKKFLTAAARKAKVRCLPAGQSLTLKDLRSSMACDLLSKGWTREEVNARLGHTPSSREIDKYINFLAIDRNRPKKKVHEHEVAKLSERLVQIENSERLAQNRLVQLKEATDLQLEELKTALMAVRMENASIRAEIQDRVNEVLSAIELKKIQERQSRSLPG